MMERNKCMMNWADILIARQGKSTIVKALVLHGVKYELLMSRPVMQELCLNLYWDGQVTTQDDRQLATFTAVGDHPQVCVLPFFESVTWSSLLDKEPPFVPNPDDDTDTCYFDARNQMQHLQLSSFGC
ncbi:hypothetical protein MTO96_033074 [Rhipicephalus appendiculatus]